MSNELLTSREIIDLVWKRAGEWNEAVAKCFMIVAEAQLAKVRPVIEKQERDKIRQELTKIDAIEDYIDRQKALVSFIYTLKGETE